MKDKLLKLYVTIQSLLHAEEGQDLVEYALIVALIALACCAGMSSLASAISSEAIRVMAVLFFLSFYGAVTRRPAADSQAFPI